MTVREQDRVPSWLVTAAAWAWRLLLVALGAAVVVQVAIRLSLVTVPLIVATILATLAAPPARWLMRRGWRPAFAAFAVVFGGVALAVGGLLALVPAFLEQTRELIPTILLAVEDLLEWLQTGPLGFDQQQLQEFGEQALTGAQEQSGGLAMGALLALVTALEFIVALILSLILLFFLVKDGDRIYAWILARTPDDHTDTMRGVVARAWDAMAGYVRGTALVALIDAAGIAIGLAIVGVPLVLPLALLVFVGAFVPIIGAFVSGLVAVMVALADGGAGTALIVLAIVVVVQQVESDVLQPLIMRRVVAVPLHPMVVLAVLVAGTVLVGVVGAFLAVPLAAVASAIANELRLRAQTGVGGPRPLGGRHGHLDEDPAPVVVGPEATVTEA
ncbi:AI-2E family transporter [Egicoccus sp. AB-alg6-2]|uniref:AI-2E family transporter n=1 Tax=Egicoccus sp. AB-alg6-2 TaxID=3242692 RepID=UPI00359E4A32